jgi:hypothetical protein
MFRQLNISSWALALGLLAAAGAPGPVRAADPAPAPPRLISLASTTPIAILVGQTVQFTDQSTGTPTSWTWDFSFDNVQPVSDSTDQNPTWTFDQVGVYPVRLEVCNDTACSAAVQDVTVVEPCTLEGDIVLPEVSPAVYDTTATYEACHTITTQGVLEIGTGGDVTFRAGHRIAFGSGFSIDSGAHFKAIIDFRLDTP